MGLLDSFFGKSESHKIAERELAELKANIAAKEQLEKAEQISKSSVETPQLQIESYNIIWMDCINTGEKMPLFVSEDKVRETLKNLSSRSLKSLKFGTKEEVAGALLATARESELSEKPSEPYKKKFTKLADEIYKEDDLEEGCDKVDALYSEVISDILEEFGPRAALECRVGAFLLTGAKLHAKNLGIDAYSFMNQGGLVEVANLLGSGRTAAAPSFRRAGKIIQQVVMPQSKNFFDDKTERTILPFLENVSELLINIPLRTNEIRPN